MKNDLLEEDTEQGLFKGGLPEMPAYWQSAPSPNTGSPRDGRRIDSSEDILFLAAVLKNLKPPVQWLKRFVLQGDLQQRYLLESTDGVFLHPVTAEAARVEDGWVPRQVITAEPLRRRLRERYYADRQALMRNMGGTVIINGLTLIQEGKRQNAHSDFLSSLRWPLNPEDDPILNQVPELNLLAFAESRAASPFDSVCPLDGPVRSLLVEIISPQSTWEHLCGQHWSLAMCPHCLGTFATELMALN